MVTFLTSLAMTMQFASGWSVDNRTLWIVVGVVFILLLAAVYYLVRTKWGHPDRPRGRHSSGDRQ
jgi:hypothetical protein